MTKDEALKLEQALHELEGIPVYKKYGVRISNAITALNEALALTSTQCEKQPAQEPVAKVVSTAPDRIWLDLGFDPQDEAEISFRELHDVTWSEDNASGNGIEYVRADTTPPAAQPAQELNTISTEELIYMAGMHDGKVLEREACAKIDFYELLRDSCNKEQSEELSEVISYAIRARGSNVSSN